MEFDNIKPNGWDTLARNVTSLPAVMLAMFIVISGMTLASHNIFKDAFPEEMETWQRIFAAWFLACGWELTVLLTTVNAKHLKQGGKNIPLICAITSGILVLIFIKAFDSTLSFQSSLLKSLLGIVVAFMNYIFSELFYAKWVERQEHYQIPKKFKELQNIIEEKRLKTLELTQLLDNYARQVDHLKRDIDHQSTELDQLRTVKQDVDRAHTCEHCGNLQPYGTIASHKAHCKENPKVKKRINRSNLYG